MLGDGFTHANPVWSYAIARLQPAAGTTTRSAPMDISALASRASSPSVMPYRIATGMNPEKAESGSPICARTLPCTAAPSTGSGRSEEHTSELQSHSDLVCRLLLEKKKQKQ